MWCPAQCLAHGKLSSTVMLGYFMFLPVCILLVFLCLCMFTYMCACVSIHRCVCLCLHVFVWINMWVCGFVQATVNCVGLLFRSVFCIVPVCGCCIHSALAGQCQQVPVLGGCGEGLQHPALGSDFLWSGQEGCSSSFPPFPPSAPFPLAPSIRIVSDHLPCPLPLPGPNQASSPS